MRSQGTFEYTEAVWVKGSFRFACKALGCVRRFAKTVLRQLRPSPTRLIPLPHPFGLTTPMGSWRAAEPPPREESLWHTSFEIAFLNAIFGHGSLHRHTGQGIIKSGRLACQAASQAAGRLSSSCWGTGGRQAPAGRLGAGQLLLGSWG